MPVSNRVNKRVGLSLKIDSDLYETFKVVLWKVNLRQKASASELVEELIVSWVEKQMERSGPDLLREWAEDRKADLESRRKWTVDEFYEMVHGEKRPERALWEPRRPDEPDYEEWVKRCEEDGI